VPGGQATRQATRKKKKTQTTRLVNSVKLFKVADLEIHQARPNGTYLKSTYVRWGPLGIYKDTEGAVLIFNSTRSILVTHMPLKNFILAFCPLNFRKTARVSVFVIQRTKKT
jgi:hypothetical protein